MKINEVINAAVKHLGSEAEGRLAAEVLLAYCLDVKKEDLFLRAENEVEGPQLERFLELVNRHFEGEPVAYLVNKKEFYGLDFYVDSRVLIPRPETELMVDEVLRRVGEYYDGLPVKILDVGTGSGCIAITLAKKLPKAGFVATDVSGDALQVAVKNAEMHKVSGRIDFVCANLLENVNGRFDVIVANLPYIGEVKYNFVSREARDYEPSCALFGGDNGLRIYEKLFEQICGRDWRPRFLLGEFGFAQGDEMRTLLGKYFEGQFVEIIKDYASIERMFVIEFGSHE